MTVVPRTLPMKMTQKSREVTAFSRVVGPFPNTSLLSILSIHSTSQDCNSLAFGPTISTIETAAVASVHLYPSLFFHQASKTRSNDFQHLPTSSLLVKSCHTSNSVAITSHSHVDRAWCQTRLHKAVNYIGYLG